MHRILLGVRYLHAKGIVHRDIKGANVLITETGVAKLADFGCSKQMQGVNTASVDESIQAIKGSIPWMAPEVIRQAGHGRKADIWSVGATVIEMLGAAHPWPDLPNNLSALFHVATSDEAPPLPPGREGVSPALRGFIYDCCMCIDPAKRLPAARLLKHQFLAEGEG